MKIWYTVRGERGEGGSVQNLYFSKREAIDACVAYAEGFPNSWVRDSETEWSAQVDWLEVFEDTVHGRQPRPRCYTVELHGPGGMDLLGVVGSLKEARELTVEPLKHNKPWEQKTPTYWQANWYDLRIKKHTI